MIVALCAAWREVQVRALFFPHEANESWTMLSFEINCMVVRQLMGASKLFFYNFFSKFQLWLLSIGVLLHIHIPQLLTYVPFTLQPIQRRQLH